MIRTRHFLLPILLLGGCVAPEAERPPRASAPARTNAIPATAAAGLQAVMNHDARALERLLGRPSLDVREGTARKLQFAGPACVLDAYLYPPRQGGEPLVTHIDARLPDGRDFDRASCVAALTAQRATR
jgi:hypothetical protein